MTHLLGRFHLPSFREKGSCPVKLLPPHSPTLRPLVSVLLQEPIGEVRGYEWMARHILSLRLMVTAANYICTIPARSKKT